MKSWEVEMENLVVEQTRNTPNLVFTVDGNFELTGKMYSEDVMSFFKPILQWLEDFSSATVEFTIKLDYINTSASKMLFTVLKSLDENCSVNSIKINWYYEEDDEDHFETGKEYEDSFERMVFEFYEITDDLLAA